MRPRRDEGFAMAVAVLVMTVLVMLVAAMLLPIVRDTTTARRAASLVDNRLMAESVMNELFSEIRLDRDAVPEPLLAGRVAPGRTVSDAGPLSAWATWDVATSSAVRCPDLATTCYYYAIAASSAAAAQADYVVAEVTVRSRCAVASSCVYRRYQQRWHRRRFLDFALFTEYETLAPSLYLAVDRARVNPDVNCNAPAGVGSLADAPTDGTRSRQCSEVFFASLAGTRNEVNGPIHTNDPQFWVCGSPRFTSLVEATSDQPLRTLGGACSANPVVDDPITNLRKGPVLELPSTVTDFAAITPNGYRFTGTTDLALDGDRMLVTPGSSAAAAISQEAPPRGLVYVDGDVSVHGSGADLTIVSTGSITISGDLLGTNIGLVAEKDVVISYASDVRRVQASLLSRSGTIYNAGLRTPRPAGGDPRLEFTGAMVSKFHPVSGIFDPTDGRLVSGMVSIVNYPSEPPNPPYFLEPIQALWERVDLTEIPLGLVDASGTIRGLTGVPSRTVTGPKASCASSSSGDGVYLSGCMMP